MISNVIKKAVCFDWNHGLHCKRSGEAGSGLLTLGGFTIAFRRKSRPLNWQREVLLVTNSSTYFQGSFTSGHR